jgi:hypothetical protein
MKLNSEYVSGYESCVIEAVYKYLLYLLKTFPRNGDISDSA